jgi:Putative lumazine-binding
MQQPEEPARNAGKSAPESTPFLAVSAVVSDYFDGLHHSDTKRLSRVFHPDARYVCATETPLLQLGMGDYFPVVDKRPSPASRGEKRNDRIISISFAGPVTAFVHAECSIGAKFFTDFLTFIRVEGRWQIIAKVFHFDLRP